MKPTYSKLLKLKKQDMFEEFVKRCNTFKEEIERLDQKIAKLVSENIKKDNALTKYKKLHTFQLKHNQKVFIESITAKGIIRTYLGYVLYESSTHIMINILDQEGFYQYVIRKDMILGKRKINKKEITGMKIFRGSVVKDWKQEVKQ